MKLVKYIKTKNCKFGKIYKYKWGAKNYAQTSVQYHTSHIGQKRNEVNHPKYKDLSPFVISYDVDACYSLKERTGAMVVGDATGETSSKLLEMEKRPVIPVVIYLW